MLIRIRPTYAVPMDIVEPNMPSIDIENNYPAVFLRKAEYPFPVINKFFDSTITHTVVQDLHVIVPKQLVNTGIFDFLFFILTHKF